MPTQAFGELRLDVREEPRGVIRVEWRGKSNMPNPESVLTPFLENVTSRATQSSSALELHFEELEFFNSSTISTIIRYLKKLPHELRVDVFYDPKHAWQKIFFDALWFVERAHKQFRIQACEG
jgi:hypothetical protein